ncbi:nucleotidyl transferase AbiEii/AbiGii toxin family protein [Niveibacterium sp.]|uniref:nucleotidyl transferase AbiEii/AbiGii toxin family protein n=1 Tax=Niveibacterium sp. TaxID=2017444 RepID=UPI0035B1F3CF
MTAVSAKYWNDPTAVAILAELNAAAAKLGIRYCVVGATARDLVMYGVYGLAVPSATRDIDFAVGVDDWATYEQLRAVLVDTGNFEVGGDVQHLVRYRAGGGYPLDLIPFGGVTDEREQLHWPPRADPVMNLVGYRDVVANALLLELPGGVTASVASIPGFVLLKLFAWSDRWSTTRRDVGDVAYVMREYQSIPSVFDRLYGHRHELLETADDVLEVAAIMLLGEDVRSMASPDTVRALTALLSDDKLRQRLCTHMEAADALGGYRVDAEAALEWFARGLSGAAGATPDT